MTFKNAALLFITLTGTLLTINTAAKNIAGATQGQLYFIENKGQITDQYHRARTDIQYALQTPGVNIFIGNGQIHYQFTKTTINYPNLPALLKKDFESHIDTKIEQSLSTIQTYRMDVTLSGANAQASATMEEPQQYYENYYLTGCPEQGIQAHTCTRIVYKNVYKGIDWVISIKNNKLEHEFVVGPGGNASDIKLTYNGQSSVKINEDGSITAATPMGTISEHAPVCYGPDGTVVQSAFRLKGNMLSYNAGKSQDVIIDPTLEWGTYYGPDSNNTTHYGAICDQSGNIYSCGLTYSPTSGNVATTGSYQATYGGNCDAFLVKFDSTGHRVWGTYYGGSQGDWANAVTMDYLGNIYLLGTTSSSNAISTIGSQQPTWGGSWDGFLAKFTTAGTRKWGTYSGGSDIDYPYGIAADIIGHVYIAGSTNSTNNISTPGSYKPTHGGGHDDYMMQYDTTGVLQWGTYYGGNSDDLGGVVASDGLSVYLAGYTFSATGISTPMTHQVSLAGSSDAFLAKFTAAGVRLWGSYFGGATPESVGGVACDYSGGLYVLGATGSDTGIATSGCFQPTRGGAEDAFLSKWVPDLGAVQWSTYYGGPDAESIGQGGMSCDNLGHVFITGFTASTSGIASTSDAWQTTYGGGDADAFFAMFNASGSELWSTYYGGTAHDEGRACAFDGESVYLCGETTSPNNIATSGSFLDTGGSGPFYYQGFIAKFAFTDTPAITLNANNQQVTADEQLTIYPNPNRGTFTLNGTLPGETGEAEILITDLAGRTILTDKASIYNGALHKQVTCNVPAGVYLLKVVEQKNTHVLRFVKE